MRRASQTFVVKNTKIIKQQMLNWSKQFGIFCFLDSHNYPDKYRRYDCLVAAGCHKSFSPAENVFSQIDLFYSEINDWIFGHLNYDLKNEIEDLQSRHENKIGFPDIYFFVPITVLYLKKNELTISTFEKDPRFIFDEIKNETLHKYESSKNQSPPLNAVLSREEYIQCIQKLQQHILYGDCYEINFCHEFFAEKAIIDPLFIYNKLTGISPTPFSCFYKLEDKYAACASPERFMTKRGNYIFSQPIKGTAPREAGFKLDEAEKKQLHQNKKERSENVMIVDLVRNDLSKICEDGSVEAEELFGIYSFPQVHQMISTIKGRIKNNIAFSETLKALFPMGSMTGAPKLRAMQLIEKYEKTRRQLFSGSIGYISPEKDFDFNVVIRSIFYNSTNQYLNYLVGSAITFYADAEKEYEECLLKAKAINETLE